MLDNLFNKPLELKVGNQTLVFNSSAEIAFCLDGRTSVSADKLAELLKMPIDKLKQQQQEVNKANKSLIRVLNDIVDKPDSIERSMRELDTQMFSQDQSWRDIFQALNNSSEEINNVRVTVVTKYLKYLSTIEDTIEYILSEKERYAGEMVQGENEQPIDFGATWAVSQLRNEIKPDISTDDGFRLLPKNKKVLINITPGKKIDMRLSSYPCQIIAMNDSISFIDNSGARSLNKGQNTIGRSEKCSLKIDPTQKHVSRRHLHVLVADNNKLQLTDTSSEGTYVNTDFIT
jgi:hypothetical protein